MRFDSDAFNTGMKSGSDAALETIKEKIKKDAEKNTLQTKSTAIDIAAFQDIERLKASGASEEEITSANQVLEGINAMKDVSLKENIYKAYKESSIKLQEEKVKSSMREKQFGSQMEEMISKIQELQGGGQSTQITQPSGDGSTPTPSPVETTLSTSSTGPKASFKLKNQAEMAKEQYEIRKLQREETESTQAFKQSAELRSIDNELTKKELVDSLDAAQKANSAIDAFSSLKTSFYEGFDPQSIAPISGTKELEDATLDAIFSQKKDALGKLVNSKIGKNPQAASFLRNVEAFSTLISRGGFDEKGTLTDKDRKVVVKAFNLALANKEESDNQFGIIQGILSKSSLRYAKKRIEKLSTPIEKIDLPFGMKEKVKQFKKANPNIPDGEIVDFLIEKAEALSG